MGSRFVPCMGGQFGGQSCSMAYNLVYGFHCLTYKVPHCRMCKTRLSLILPVFFSVIFATQTEMSVSNCL